VRTIISDEEKQFFNRVANEPFFWIRKYVEEVKHCEEEFFSLVDTLKRIWEECRIYRIDLGFALRICIEENPQTSLTISDYKKLQKQQNESNSTLIYEVDLVGNILGEIDLGQEIEPFAVMNFSKMRDNVVFWLGHELQIFCKGYEWVPKNKQDILKEIKSKRREKLLSMGNYRAVLDKHYEQCIRDEARVH